jgi:O-antigen/teichoic acid export membrane protein
VSLPSVSKADPEPAASIGAHTLARGVAWIGAARWGSQLLAWVVTLIVVRILSPTDYGVVGMTAFFITLAGALAESGIGSAVVALRELTPQAIRQLHAVAIGAGFAAAGITAAAAWPASRYFHEPALLSVMAVLGLSFALDGFRVVPVAVINRELNYRQSSSVDLVRAVASAATVLILALKGAKYWSLVGAAIAGSAAASLWTFRLKRVAVERPRLRVLNAPLRYCRHAILTRLAYSAYQSADFMIAGKMFGPGPLGQYNVAWTIASLPGEKLTTVILGATMPFFAAIQHDREALARYYLRLTRFLSLVLWPTLFGFMVVADLAIPLVLGEKWLPAVPLTRALLFYTALLSIGLNNVILSATGRSRSAMQLAFLALVLLPPAFYIGGKLGGVLGIAWAWTAVFPIVMACTLYITLRALQVSFGSYLGALRRPALLVGLMCAGVALTRFLLVGRVSRPIELVIAIAAGAVLYGALCLAFAREDLAIARVMWRRKS